VRDGEGEVRRSGDEYDWIHAAARSARDELAAWFATTRAICRAPARFGRAWAIGEANALNPLAFLATSAALIGIAIQAGEALTGDADDNSLLTTLWHWLQPYALFALFGLFAHLLLRRKRARSSVAMALYAGAGPATLCGLFCILLVTILRVAVLPPTDNLLEAVPPWLRVLLLALMWSVLIWFWISLTMALAGLHGVPYWRSALAVLWAQLVLAVVVEILVNRKIITPANPFLPIVQLGIHRSQAGHWRPFVHVAY
jgi:hypothetical protein